MKKSVLLLTLCTILLVSATLVPAQSITRDVKLGQGSSISVINFSGRVEIVAKPDSSGLRIVASSPQTLAESELKVDATGNLRVETLSAGAGKRIDLSIVVPERVKLKVETRDGEIRVSGDVELIEAKTDTGTIAADVPTGDLKYDFFWTESRPRYLSDIELEKVKEKSGGKFQLKGKFKSDAGEEKEKGKKGEGEKETDESDPGAVAPAVSSEGTGDGEKDKEKKKKDRSSSVELAFTTGRGIILLNVPPNEVSSDLRERPLTNAAKAIIRSGDLGLMDAIRRASPKYFGDYSRTLPPMRREPSLTSRTMQADVPGDTTKEAVLRVTDMYNRSIADLKASDFTVAENGAPRDIISVRPHTAPVNLVLLLDVSGSVDNYVNFIRKAARSFIETAREGDRVSLILFNDDVKVLSGFSTNKTQLSESLDTFDAGGATAYYDAVAYTLADTLRPLRGERTAIVVLTDGDDNRSFLSFDSLLGSIEESGALIYPLYVPSALIATSESNDPDKAIDPLRTRYMTLSARAEGEGERLAKVSGGVYYPITQLSQIQKAYDDIVTQIRTAYSVTFRSGFQADPNNRPSPRLKIRVNKPNAFVQVNSVSVSQR
ncbi:MAG TPA: VWA domain-containing protein [Pyrinomonadaceae bacterium]|nr:VWA domain-containing protein [Pyrinomonadaceae bacterium]